MQVLVESLVPDPDIKRKVSSLRNAIYVNLSDSIW